MEPGNPVSQTPFGSDERGSASLVGRPGDPTSEPSSVPNQLRPESSLPNFVDGTLDQDQAVDLTSSFAEKSEESLQNPVEVMKERSPSSNGIEMLPCDDAGKGGNRTTMESNAELDEPGRLEGNSLEQACEAEEVVAGTLRAEEGQHSPTGTIDQDANERMDVSQPTSSCDDVQDSQQSQLKYFLDKPPSLLAESLEDFMCNRDNYLKGCKWWVGHSFTVFCPSPSPPPPFHFVP